MTPKCGNILNKNLTSFSGGGSLSTWREPLTMGKQLVSFITCGCELSAAVLIYFCLDLKNICFDTAKYFVNCIMGETKKVKEKKGRIMR
jgi:hypothetical protein